MLCVARFFPNMENAMQTSPRLKQFLQETVLGDWGAEPEDVYLMVHSLGNLVTLDALRLHALQSDEILINHLIAVEAAVWQEAFWDQGPVSYGADLTFSEDALMRGSWAFWFNQDASPVSKAFHHMFNSFTRNDEALVAMKINDYFPVLGPPCVYPMPGPPPGPCPREERRDGRGSGQHYRVPVADELLVGDTDNRPDLGYEIPALLNLEFPTGIRFLWNDLTNPLGMDEVPLNSVTNIDNIDTAELAWPEGEHSWFLEGPIWEIWPWYEFFTRPSGEPPRMIIPSGEE